MKTEVLTSTTNSKFKIWKDLLSGRGIREHGLCLISGTKIVNEVLNMQPDRVAAVLSPSEDELCSLKTDRQPNQTFLLSQELFNELDELGTRKPILVFRPESISSFSNSSPNGLEVVAPLSDPNNLGALLRTCAAFDVSRVILTKESASPFLPKALRASSGMSLMVKLEMGPSLQELAASMQPENQQNMIALDMNGESLKTFKWPKNVRIFIGEEGQGLPQAFKVRRVSIPMSQKTESLNATVAASLALFSYRLQNEL